MTRSSIKYLVGVDMGGTKILASVIDDQGQILSRSKTATKTDQAPEHIIDRIADRVQSAMRKAKVEKNQVEAIGIGAPGPLDPHTGVVIFAPNLNWKNVHLKKELEQRTGIPTFLDNDVNVGTLGECAFGAGRGKKSVVGIFIGTGIGGGIVIDDQVFYGASLTAGEIGHIILKVGGPKCGCGNRGCFEALASRTAITKQLQKRILKKKQKSILPKLNGGQMETIKSGAIARAFRKGDRPTIKAIKKAAEYIGIGIASTVNFLNPETVILGGGLIEALGEDLVDRIRYFAEDYAMEHAMSGVEITSAQLGDNAGILGAAVLARQRLGQSHDQWRHADGIDTLI